MHQVVGIPAYPNKISKLKKHVLFGQSVNPSTDDFPTLKQRWHIPVGTITASQKQIDMRKHL